MKITENASGIERKKCVISDVYLSQEARLFRGSAKNGQCPKQMPCRLASVIQVELNKA